MTKRQSIALNSLTLILLHVVFWICNYYPRHIIEDSRHALPASLLNLVFFVLYAFVLIIIFAKNSTLFSSHIFAGQASVRSRVCLGKLFAILGAQVTLDILCLASGLTESEYAFILSDTLIILSWVLTYLILAANNKTLRKNKKALAIVVGILTAVSIMILLFDSKLIVDYQAACQQYVSGCDYLANYRNNLDFMHSIGALILDSVVACTLVVFHMSLVAPRASNIACKKCYSSVQFSVRVGVLFAAMLILYACKAFILPYAVFQEISGSNKVITRYLYDGSYYCNLYHTKIYRVSDDFKQKLCYQSLKSDVYCDKTKVGTMQHMSAADMYFSTGNTEVQSAAEFTEYRLDDITVYVYRQGALCFTENGKPCMIPFDEIKSCAENPIITEMCRRLISEGNITVFEYAAAYLYAHDKEFIVPYIVRYEQGDFNEIEAKVLEALAYRPEYISDIATSLNNTMGP